MVECRNVTGLSIVLHCSLFFFRVSVSHFFCLFFFVFVYLPPAFIFSVSHRIIFCLCCCISVVCVFTDTFFCLFFLSEFPSLLSFLVSLSLHVPLLKEVESAISVHLLDMFTSVLWVSPLPRPILTQNIRKMQFDVYPRTKEEWKPVIRSFP